MNAIHDTAYRALGVGICSIPAAADGTKRPFPDGRGNWAEYQQRLPTPAELDRWFARGHAGVGLVTGSISGNLEMLEFEGRAVDEGILEQFDQLADAAGLYDLVRRLTDGYLEKTPSGGIHLLYRCETIEGNLKLARRPATPAELEDDPTDKVKVLLETRGEGGFTIVAPSNGTTHPTGGAWVLSAGGLDTIPTITPDERRALHDLARSFDRMPRIETTVAKAAPAATSDYWEVRPGDEWAQKTTWPDILEPHGWAKLYTSQDGNQAWRRPGKDTPGLSATINEDGNGCLYVFTSSTPFDPGKAYSKLSAHIILDHGGDFDAAYADLVDRGYGTPAVKPEDLITGESTPDKPPTVNSPASDLFRRWTMTELLAEPDEFRWDIPGMLAHLTYGQVAGEMKTLKTYITMMVMVGLAGGVPIFDHFTPTRPLPVVAYIGEGGRIPYMRRLRRVAASMGVNLADIPLTLSFDTAPVTSTVFQESLARDLAELNPGLVTVDPLYAYHGTATKAADLHAEGSLLNAVSAPCIDAGANLLIVNHFNQTGSGTGLKRITMAGSGEHSDTWLLLAHRETPDVEAGEFKLTLEIGSRQWGGTTWDLDLTIGRFDEDTGHHDGDITWDLNRATSGPRTTPDGPSPKVAATRVAILDVLADRPWQLTKTETYERVGGNKATFAMAFFGLVDDGRINHNQIARDEGGITKKRPLWGQTANPPQTDGAGSMDERE